MRNRRIARYTARMPLPPTDPPARSRSANPARIMLNSPLAAAMRARVYHQRTRPRPRERGLHAVGAIGALLVHLVFLVSFVLGPAYPLAPPPPESPQDFLQVRLIEPPEPPPPPPVRGTPPKEVGPRHQGRSSHVAPSRERSVNVEAVVGTRPAPAAAAPVIANAVKPRAPEPKPVAAPKPPVSLPQPAPTPELQPIPLAGEPPTIALPEPTLQPPVPPTFQPESVRKPQLEGNQQMPPPSLALPEVPPQSPPPISAPSIALQADVPNTPKPASVTPARAELPAAPPVPELQPIPLPAQPSPSVNLQTSLSMPTPTVPKDKPQVQAPAIEVAEAELEAVPLSPVAPTLTEAQPPTVKIDVADTARLTAPRPSIERPELSTPPALTATPTPTVASQPAESSSSATADQPATTESTPSPGDTSSGRDVSRAPDATPQGSDTATLGEPDGAIDTPAKNTGAQAVGTPPKAGQGSDNGSTGESQDSGQPGGNQPGADQGEKQGALGSYVQLKPSGDTQIMRHNAPNIGYKPTRFEQDWAPEGESSIDTALRRAVEKTTVKHTFHLPRGIRVECAVMPLLPIALLGCGNPDPPAELLDQEIYDRLNLAPANPLVPPAPSTSTAPAPAPMIKLDNSAQCSAARVAGSPPPPGCEGIVLPVKPASTPASSSSSWVPASDQFH